MIGVAAGYSRCRGLAEGLVAVAGLDRSKAVGQGYCGAEGVGEITLGAAAVAAGQTFVYTEAGEVVDGLGRGGRSGTGLTGLVPGGFAAVEGEQ